MLLPFSLAGSFEMTPDARQLAADVRWGIQRAGLTLDQAAREMGLEPSQLTRQLAHRDHAHLSLLRLARLPCGFWKEFIAIRAVRCGQRVLDDDIADLVTNLRTLLQDTKRRPIKMALQPETEQEPKTCTQR